MNTSKNVGLYLPEIEMARRVARHMRGNGETVEGKSLEAGGIVRLATRQFCEKYAKKHNLDPLKLFSETP